MWCVFAFRFDFHILLFFGRVCCVLCSFCFVLLRAWVCCVGGVVCVPRPFVLLVVVLFVVCVVLVVLFVL